MDVPERDLFGNRAPDRFETARAKYGVWPTTVWDVDLQDRTAQELKEAVGDTGTARALLNPGAISYKAMGKKAAGGPDELVSIFNPAVAMWCLNLWAKNVAIGSLVLDPFAGGGTRAITCAKRGYHYTGVELRETEAMAVAARCEHNKVRCTVADGMGRTVSHPPEPSSEEEDQWASGTVRVIVGDSRSAVPIPEAERDKFDFLFTCPPYWRLEQYSEDVRDLSAPTTTYLDYLTGLSAIIGRCHDALKPGARSVWVLGLCRGEDGNLRAIHHDVARLHQGLGYYFGEEVVLAMRNQGALRRVGNVERGHGHLIRTHEYVLVFRR